MRNIKIAAVMWPSYMPSLAEGAREIPGLELKMCNSRNLNDVDFRQKFLQYMLEEAEVLLLFPGEESFWQEMTGELEELAREKPTVSFGFYPEPKPYNNMGAEAAAMLRRYLLIGGIDNARNALLYVLQRGLGGDFIVEPPIEMPWQGIYHPYNTQLYTSLDSYQHTCPAYVTGRPTVGILFYRHLWLNKDLAVIDALINCLQSKGINALAVFSADTSDAAQGAQANQYAIENFFLKDGQPVIAALIYLQAFFLLKKEMGSASQEEGKANCVNSAQFADELLQRLDVPIFKGLLTYGKTEAEWRQDGYGISGRTMVTLVAMPECNGVIEPIVIASQERVNNAEIGGEIEWYLPVKGRIEYFCQRIKRWVDLRQKPAAKRKIAFILHNNPCHGTEVSVGGAANLDSLASLAEIMHAMLKAGYSLDNLPANGRELIELIMERKAISDFRWTPLEEIVAKGGVLEYLEEDVYRDWFKKFPDTVRESMITTWGQPPGELKDGVPAAMVYDGRIIITGVEFGNVVVCVQPKRGCAGARCDGKVCKILHDPECPPTHQYVATYRYLEEVWGADALVHVGTHGNLEFLPGKSLGLTEACFPELTLGTLPHIYIYNTDNPPEGTIAKRRSYAALVGHMQTVMLNMELYGELADLDRMLGEYREMIALDQAQAEVLAQEILIKAAEAQFATEIDLSADFKVVQEKLHGLLNNLKSRNHQDGEHIFGHIPAGDSKVDFLHAILRNYRSERGTLSDLAAAMLGEDSNFSVTGNLLAKALLRELLTVGSKFNIAELESGKAINLWVEITDRALAALDVKSVNKAVIPELEKWLSIVKRIEGDLLASREMDSLLHILGGGYLPAGPSGLISRGRPDILPTGRNFYSADPDRIPTQAAWQVGKKLAEALLERHKADTGRLPENCAMVLFASDCMWTDGEQIAQILALLGVEPQWVAGDRVKGFRIIPLSELGRPRIDVTLRICGITRDCYQGIIAYLDDAIQAVATLPEEENENFIRMHTLAQMAGLQDGSESAWQQATARIFGAKQGTYGAGVDLAVHASAWRTEEDLSDIFLAWSGYAYGRNRQGEDAASQFRRQLQTVDLTYNKAATDEYDLFGCCCHFAYYGGLTAAAHAISGKEIKTYYGDTRDPRQAKVVTLAEEINNVVRVKVLNPEWIAGMQKHGYKGAADLAKKITHIYGWEATTGVVGDWIFDSVAKTYVLNEEMRQWFAENNPWALEEINRRLLEANQRGLWETEPEILAGLQEAFMEIEGWMEEKMGTVQGEFQGSSVDVITAKDVPAWQRNMDKRANK